MGSEASDNCVFYDVSDAGTLDLILKLFVAEINSVLLVDRSVEKILTLFLSIHSWHKYSVNNIEIF